MSQPLFSIVIPTRNRSELVARAIESVLGQTLGDFELIVSDNSDRMIPKADVLGRTPLWRDDPRVRYVRPPEFMLMPAHWNFATSFATGKYVAILTDRFVMRPSSLEALAETISAHPTGDPDLVVWNVQSSYFEDSRSLATPQTGGEVQIIPSRDLLSDFLRFSSWRTGSFFFNKLPRGLNSIYRRELALKIIEEHGRLFRLVSPDYSSAFLFMAFASEVLYLDLPLYIAHGDQSNGLRSMVHGVSTYVTCVDPFEGCPMRIDTVFNSVVRDFLAVKRLVHPRLKDYEIDTVGYFLSNYRELIDKELLGSPLDLKPLYCMLRAALLDLPTDQQNAIREGVQTIEGVRPSSFHRVKQKMIRRWHLDGPRNRVRELMSRHEHKAKGGSLYANVGEAARATDDCVRAYLLQVPSFVK